MSHPAAWTCRACGCLLGQVRRGGLTPLAAVEFIDAQGEARLRCPTCGRARLWFPSAAAAAAAGDRRPADRPR